MRLAKYTVEVWKQVEGRQAGSYFPVWSGDLLPNAYAAMANAKEEHDTVALVWRTVSAAPELPPEVLTALRTAMRQPHSLLDDHTLNFIYRWLADNYPNEEYHPQRG
jgi:hypothetical protein